MQNPLEGRSLVWLSLDANSVFTAASLTMIKSYYQESESNSSGNGVVATRLAKFETWESLNHALFGTGQSEFTSTGLVTLVIRDASDVANAAKLLWRLRGLTSHPLSVCYLDTELRESIGLLLEAGAQIVISQLPSWQRILPRVLAKVPLCQRGFHPLTRGLVDRLPWSTIQKLNPPIP
jgi:hypothetical protein